MTKTENDLDQRIEETKIRYYKDEIKKTLETEDRLSTLRVAYHILTKEEEQ